MVSAKRKHIKRRKFLELSELFFETFTVFKKSCCIDVGESHEHEVERNVNSETLYFKKELKQAKKEIKDATVKLPTSVFPVSTPLPIKDEGTDGSDMSGRFSLRLSGWSSSPLFKAV